MSIAQIRWTVPRSYAILLGAALTASFAYAVFVRQLLLWLFGVVALATFVLSVCVVYLFYRLVVAVERIANGS
ncbi:MULTISPECIES: hypothetical protein [Natrialbaceae]|uniref:hypothetical protein n=1 Tax=Natrialbaceae TaxID=1644061 RepID=UPI00207C1748|nr:hypothetical protein [Natronococcus sp. CG52]